MIPFQFPNCGNLPLTFDPVEHRYELDGVWIPGVTTICGMLPKPWMQEWAKAEMGKRITELYNLSAPPTTPEDLAALIKSGKSADTDKSDEGKRKGTVAHEWIENHILGLNPDLPTAPEELVSVNLFRAWEDKAKPVYEACELVVASEKYQYGGKLDVVCSLAGVRTLLDFKTSKTISESWGPQTAAYVHAFQEMGGGGIEQRLVLRLPSEGFKKIETVEYPIRSSMDFDLQWFLHLKGVYEHLRDYNNAKKK